jgi:ABC-type multidrug transport system fused ATPase/permease subunit
VLLADPRVFLLDEATSSIDTVTELEVQAALIGLVGVLIPAYKGLKPTIVEALRYGRDV